MNPADYGWPDIWVTLIIGILIGLVIAWPNIKINLRVLELIRRYYERVRTMQQHGMCVRCQGEFRQNVQFFDQEKAS